MAEGRGSSGRPGRRRRTASSFLSLTSTTTLLQFDFDFIISFLTAGSWNEFPLYFDFLPQDFLFCYFVPRYFLGEIKSERDIDAQPVPVMLLVLAMVNRSLNRALKQCHLAQNILLNFRNNSPDSRYRQLSLFLRSACQEDGSVSLMVWLTKVLKYPLLGSCLAGAAEGICLCLSLISCRLPIFSGESSSSLLALP
jgi:hypothetical protein